MKSIAMLSMTDLRRQQRQELRQRNRVSHGIWRKDLIDVTRRVLREEWDSLILYGLIVAAVVAAVLIVCGR